jgi:hypothetical protein
MQQDVWGKGIIKTNHPGQLRAQGSQISDTYWLQNSLSILTDQYRAIYMLPLKLDSNICNIKKLKHRDIVYLEIEVNPPSVRGIKIGKHFKPEYGYSIGGNTLQRYLLLFIT